jgi:hypothetical protein
VERRRHGVLARDTRWRADFDKLAQADGGAQMRPTLPAPARAKSAEPSPVTHGADEAPCSPDTRACAQLSSIGGVVLTVMERRPWPGAPMVTLASAQTEPRPAPCPAAQRLAALRALVVSGAERRPSPLFQARARLRALSTWQAPPARAVPVGAQALAMEARTVRDPRSGACFTRVRPGRAERRAASGPDEQEQDLRNTCAL